MTETVVGLHRRIEAHRWLLLALTSALGQDGALNVRSFIEDIQTLEDEMRGGNEAAEIVDEIHQVARLVRSLAPDTPESSS